MREWFSLTHSLFTCDKAKDEAMARALAGKLKDEEHPTKAKAAASSSKASKRRFVRLDISGDDSDEKFNPEKHSGGTPPCKKAKRRHVQSVVVRTRAAAARDVCVCVFRCVKALGDKVDGVCFSV